MRLIACILVAALSPLAVAHIWLENLSPIVHANDLRQISWATDREYRLDMALVQKKDNGWTPVEFLLHISAQATGEGSLTWLVPDNTCASRSYAIWLTGLHYNEDYGDAYSNLTAWFQIAGGHGTARDFYCGTGLPWFLLTVAAFCVAIAVVTVRIIHRTRRVTYERLVVQSDHDELRHACHGCKVKLWEQRAHGQVGDGYVANVCVERN